MSSLAVSSVLCGMPNQVAVVCDKERTGRERLSHNLDSGRLSFALQIINPDIDSCDRWWVARDKQMMPDCLLQTEKDRK
jgi:hypothetical protein